MRGGGKEPLTRLIRTLPLLLLVVALLAACDTSQPPGSEGPRDDTLVTSLAGTFPGYDQGEYGENVYALVMNDAHSSESGNYNLAPYLLPGEITATGAFTLDLPDPLPASLSATTTLCTTADDTPLTAGPVIMQLLTSPNQLEDGLTFYDVTGFGWLFTANEQLQPLTQVWIYSDTTRRVTGQCADAIANEALFGDIDISLFPGWNAVIATSREGQPTLTRSGVLRTNWLFSPYELPPL